MSRFPRDSTDDLGAIHQLALARIPRQSCLRGRTTRRNPTWRRHSSVGFADQRSISVESPGRHPSRCCLPPTAGHDGCHVARRYTRTGLARRLAGAYPTCRCGTRPRGGCRRLRPWTQTAVASWREIRRRTRAPDCTGWKVRRWSRCSATPRRRASRRLNDALTLRRLATAPEARRPSYPVGAGQSFERGQLDSAAVPRPWNGSTDRAAGAAIPRWRLPRPHLPAPIQARRGTCTCCRPGKQKTGPKAGFTLGIWSGRPDLNRRPPVPQTGALPDCATPRQARSLAPGRPPARSSAVQAPERSTRASQADASVSSSFDSRASRSTRQRCTLLPSNRARCTSRAIGISIPRRSASASAAWTV